MGQQRLGESHSIVQRKQQEKKKLEFLTSSAATQNQARVYKFVAYRESFSEALILEFLSSCGSDMNCETVMDLYRIFTAECCLSVAQCP